MINDNELLSIKKAEFFNPAFPSGCYFEAFCNFENFQPGWILMAQLNPTKSYDYIAACKITAVTVEDDYYQIAYTRNSGIRGVPFILAL